MVVAIAVVVVVPTCHHVIPVAHTAAASVLTIGVPSAPNAP